MFKFGHVTAYHAVALLDDVVIALGAAVATTSLIILFALLTRYQRAVEDARKSNELAKNLFDALNARLTVQDARIVDLMARLEVYSTGKILPPGPVTAFKVTPPTPTSQAPSPPATASRPASHPTSQTAAPLAPHTAPTQSGRHTNTTELSILNTLLEGPKMSNSIREIIQVTREHNARLLKGLYERGLVSRSADQKPYLYQITEAGKAFLSSAQLGRD